MRLCIYETPAKGINIFDYQVYLNGEKLETCVMADEELGEVNIIVKSVEELVSKFPKGILHCVTYGWTVIATLHGKVEVRKIGEI